MCGQMPLNLAELRKDSITSRADVPTPEEVGSCSATCGWCWSIAAFMHHCCDYPPSHWCWSCPLKPTIPFLPSPSLQMLHVIGIHKCYHTAISITWWIWWWQKAISNHMLPVCNRYMWVHTNAYTINGHFINPNCHSCLFSPSWPLEQTQLMCGWAKGKATSQTDSLATATSSTSDSSPLANKCLCQRKSCRNVTTRFLFQTRMIKKLLCTWPRASTNLHSP